MAKQNKDYGYDIQKLYLEMMLANAETFVRCQSIFDFSLFDRKLQDTAQFVNKYVTEYNTLPTYEMVNKSCNVDLKQTEQLTEEHFDWLLNDFETFVRHKSLERAILKSADMLEKGEYGPVEDLVKKAVQIGLHKDLGTDYFNDPKQRLMGLKNQNGQVSTGWTTLDKRLFGGFNKGELNIFAGGSGAPDWPSTSGWKITFPYCPSTVWLDLLVVLVPQTGRAGADGKSPSRTAPP